MSWSRLCLCERGACVGSFDRREMMLPSWHDTVRRIVRNMSCKFVSSLLCVFNFSWTCLIYRCDVAPQNNAQASFIRDHLGPIIRQDHPDVKIMAFDHNRDHCESCAIHAWAKETLNSTSIMFFFVHSGSGCFIPRGTHLKVKGRVAYGRGTSPTPPRNAQHDSVFLWEKLQPFVIFCGMRFTTLFSINPGFCVTVSRFVEDFAECPEPDQTSGGVLMKPFLHDQ